MANVTLHTGFSFMTHQDWYWEVTQYSSSSITISDGVHTQRFLGTFSFNSGRASGQVSATEYYEGGKLMYSATDMIPGFNDASRLQTHAETTGDTQATYAYVLGGNDSISGSASKDVIAGYAGNDKLDGKAGSDILLGGAGNDTYYVDNTGDKVYETTSTTSTTNAGGTDKVVSTVSFNLAAYKGVAFVEHLTLSGSSAISGIGNSLANKITGNGAANTLKGGSGNDSVSGGSGGDTLYGEKGNDTLYGNSGNDLLRGGTGNDVLYGGTGKDLFRLDAALSASTNVDRIRDFSVTDDTIQLENAIFTRFGTHTGPIASGNFKASTSGRATDSNDYILYETDTGKIFYDADGNGAGASVQVALVGTHLDLTAADFVVV